MFVRDFELMDFHPAEGRLFELPPGSPRNPALSQGNLSLHPLMLGARPPLPEASRPPGPDRWRSDHAPRLLGTSPFLPAEGGHAGQRRYRERGGTGSKEFSARKGFNDQVVFSCVHRLATP
jgi:hypothetical protein